MGDAAVRIARACNYEGAGTVEFLVDGRGEFYFMEMNTRIQVEHGVTEEITGIDLVQWQLRIADGEWLAFSQEDIAIRGHAIECRINAEDPQRNFAPRPGTVELYYAPGGFGVRVDSHIYGGYAVPSYYDSLLAKIIVTADSRQSAISRMDSALSSCFISGMPTTAKFQRAIVLDHSFKSGIYTTRFVEKFMDRMPSDQLEKNSEIED
jgi:acetyl-CoA carboxylase biotin carboxylase subunit